MVRTAKANVPAWVIASSIVLVFLGCRKPDNELGTDLLPNDPVGVVVEQATLRAYTFVDTGGPDQRTYAELGRLLSGSGIRFVADRDRHPGPLDHEQCGARDGHERVVGR